MCLPGNFFTQLVALADRRRPARVIRVRRGGLIARFFWRFDDNRQPMEGIVKPEISSADRDSIRGHFPSLATDVVFLENAGGSQVPTVVADHIRDYMLTSYVQLGAGYPLSQRCTELVDEAHEFVEGDELRLRQVLLNLLGNAIKFTDEGEIVVDVSLGEPHGEDWPRGSLPIRFSVHDTGIGIPEDKLGIIFERFTQADHSLTRPYSGSGLGLAISVG